MSIESNEKWDLTIEPNKAWFDLRLNELWRYRDLIVYFFRRDFVAFYKQTVLGPLWYIIQPIITAVVFTIIFGKVAQISTDGTPPFLFYLSGTVVWGYFSSCLSKTSETFVKNANIFGKVYFPRLTVPISVVIINLVKFSIQLVVFLGFYIYFYMRGSQVQPTLCILVLPLMVLQMALLGLGTGILISSLTTKYRDFTFLMTFAVQLWMYATPVVYPFSVVPEKYRFYYMLNPMTSVLESFRFAFLGSGVVNITDLLFSWAVTLFVLSLGILLFNRIDKTFMDTV